MRLSAIPLTVVLFFLASAAPGAAWHLEDEEPFERFGALAGDPRVLDDSAECVDAVADMEGVSCVVLYAHVLHPLSAFPMNVQRPADCVLDAASGFGMPGVEPFWGFARLVGYASPGFVEYTNGDRPCEDRPRVHPERVPADTLRIMPDFVPTVYWTLSADTLEFAPLGIGGGDDPVTPSFGALPCLTVRAVLETGRFAGAGDLLAEGKTTRTVVTAPSGNGGTGLPVEDPCPDAEGIVRVEQATEFRVPLTMTGTRLPDHESFILRVEWYQWDGGDPDEENNVVQREWNLHTGPDHVPRLVFAARTPLELDSASPRLFDGKLYFSARFHSPWGGYDLDLGNTRFVVYDETGARVPLSPEPRFVMTSSHCHDCHLTPVNLTFPFDPVEARLGPGEYTLRIEATNWQHTADASWAARLLVDHEEIVLYSDEVTIILHKAFPPRESPAPGFVALPFFAVAILFVARGRRAP